MSLDAEGIRFVTAFVSGGLVAVLSAIVSYTYAEKVQRGRETRAEAALRRRLVAELKENIRRLGDSERGWAMPMIPLVRTAWDEARALPMPKEAFDAIAAGFQAGTYASEIAGIAPRLIRPWGFLQGRRVKQFMQSNIEQAQGQAKVARECFAHALRALDEDSR